MEFIAVFIEYPRDLVSVQATNNVGSYANPSDNLLIRTAYFGDSTISGDVRPLKVVSEETLKNLHPSWLDATANSQSDRPEYMIQLDRNTIHVFPRPNTVGSATGKKIWLNYNYVPASMSSDSDTPDLPLPYHGLLPIYAAHLCYIALSNPEMSQSLYGQFLDKTKRLQSAVTKEAKDLSGFSFACYGDVDVGEGSGGITP